MPFLLAKILNFQGTVHLIGVGSLSYKYIDDILQLNKEDEMQELDDLIKRR